MENLNVASAYYYSAIYESNTHNNEVKIIKLYTLKEFKQAKKDFKEINKDFPNIYSFITTGNPFTSVEDAKERIKKDNENF